MSNDARLFIPPQGDMSNIFPSRKWAVLACISLGVFMCTLDSSIVGVTLPTIATTFHAPFSAIEWVSSGYLLTNAMCLIPLGQTASRLGSEKLFVCGLVVFTMASALCGISLSLRFLLLSRVVQGLGCAMMLAVSMSIITSAFPVEERGRALGWNTVMVALGTSAGPSMGSILSTYATWHWVFALNVPLGLTAILMAVHVFRVCEVPHQIRSREPFDLAGAMCFAGGIGGIMVYLSFGQELGWTSDLLLACLLGGLALLLLFPSIEHRQRFPLVDLTLFRNRRFLFSILSLLLCSLSLMSVSFLLPFYCREDRGDSALLAGAVLMSFPVTLGLISPLSGALADRVGARWLTTIGLIMAAIGLALISALDAHSPLLDMIWRLVFTGAGQALFLAPNNAVLMGSVLPEQRGSASGFLATSRTLGQTVGIALSGSVFNRLGGGNAGQLLMLGHPVEDQLLSQLHSTFTLAFRLTFWLCASLAILGGVLSFLRGRTPVVSHRERKRKRRKRWLRRNWSIQ